MPRKPKVELTPELIEETVSRFRYHRPTVDGEIIADPKIAKEPYRPYEFGEAAHDTLYARGFNPRKSGALPVSSALADEARKHVPNADKILQRRKNAAKYLNKLFRQQHGLD